MQAATAYAPESPAKLNATGDVGQGYKDSLSSLHAMLNQGTNLNQVDFTQATLEAIDACCGGGCLTEGGKNNSGNYVFKRDKNNFVIIDKHGHPEINHDLIDIAEEFKKFAKKERLNFW